MLTSFQLHPPSGRHLPAQAQLGGLGQPKRGVEPGNSWHSLNADLISTHVARCHLSAGEGPSAAGASKPPRSDSRQAPPSPFEGAQGSAARQDGSQGAGSSGQGSRHDSGPPGLEPKDGRPLASWDPYNVPRSSRVMRMSRSQQQVGNCT